MDRFFAVAVVTAAAARTVDGGGVAAASVEWKYAAGWAEAVGINQADEGEE